MTSLAKSCIALVLAILAVPAATQGFLEMSPNAVSRDRVVQQLRSLIGHGQKKKRLASIEDLLRPTVMALPRDSHDGLEHHVARYALYRYFLVQHGWRIKGLSLEKEKEETHVSSPAVILKSSVPSLVMDLLQDKMGSGRLGLEGLAVVVATFEDLVRSDSVDLLELAYKTLGLSTDEPLDEEEADLLIRTFALYFVLPEYQQIADDRELILSHLTSRVARSYPGWKDTMLWVGDVGRGLENQDSSVLRSFTATAGQHPDFTLMANWAIAISAGFGRFLDIECKEMKNKLLDSEDEEREDGRVGFGEFYAPLAASGHIWFSESPAYLRHIGAVDEQNPRKPSVIMTNLLYGESNCMATSGFHMVCCIDACEALMAGLEQQVSEPAGTPALIATVVSAMPSDTIAAPRNLSAPLRSRLDEIAGRHGGRVPLHSRLFAQWMHYAYPNECPYPRALLSSEPLLTSTEWATQNRQDISLTRRDARALVHGLNGHAREEEVASDGPVQLWSEDEELLSDLLIPPKRSAEPFVLTWVAGVAALAATAFEIYRVVRSHVCEKGGKPINRLWLGGGSASLEGRTHFV